MMRRPLGSAAARGARGTVAVLLATSLIVPAAVAQSQGPSIDPETWTPDYVRSIAGTESVDTAAECSEVTPLDHEGRVTFWYTGPTQAEPELHREMDTQFWEAVRSTYPNIEFEVQSLGYNDMLNKLRTAALGNAAPMAARMPILWGVEFAAKGQLAPLSPEDVGYETGNYWPGAIKSVTWEGETYGVPSNNETMALIWNAGIFREAGLDPEKAPETWAEVVAFSDQIKRETGKAGYGLVARVNAGNTPFRFMPVMWAEGGGAFDEAKSDPTYQEIMVNSEGSRRALQHAYDMYVRDKSVPVSALTNTQTENQDPFLAGQLAMMIAHPSEYANMLDRARQATGSDREAAQEVVDNMRYGQIPRGEDGRRAVVFGGSNFHMFDESVVDGGEVDRPAVLALACMMTGPEWSTKLSWVVSNPSNVRGFRTEWMAERLDTIKFLDVATSMLPHGVPFPVIPESPEVMNIIIPEMMQKALTEQMTVEEAAADAEQRIQALRDGF